MANTDVEEDIPGIDIGTTGAYSDYNTWKLSAAQGERFTAVDAQRMFIAMTTAGAAASESVVKEVDFVIKPITYYTGTSLALTDAHENVTVNNSSPVAITVPAGIVGKMYRIKNLGSGAVTLTGDAQNFFDSASRVTMSLALGDTICIQWDGNYWVVWF